MYYLNGPRLARPSGRESSATRLSHQQTTLYGPYSRGGHIGHRQQISYPEPRVEMFENELIRRAKAEVFNPSGLNMAAV